MDEKLSDVLAGMGNIEQAYLRHSAHDRRVAPLLRFLPSLLGGRLAWPSDPLKVVSGEDMVELKKPVRGRAEASLVMHT